MSRNLAIISIGSLFLAACESTSGIVRTSQLAAFPDPECVSQALQSTGGINALETSGGEASGLHFMNAYYSGDGVTIHLGIFQRDSGSADFTHSMASVARVPTAAEIATARSMMLATEQMLAATCGIAQLRDNVTESCSGPGCDG